jgi:20S proteasome subunit beta 3
MAGDHCVAIASDRRFGIQAQTVATDLQKVFRVHDRLWLGLPGLATDMQTLAMGTFLYNFFLKKY